MEQRILLTPVEFDRETAKQLLFSESATREERQKGLSLMIRASQAGDPEAMYHVGRLMLEGKISLREGDSQDYAVSLLCSSAQSGFLAARTLLTSFCEWRYRRDFPEGKEQTGPLTDFNGNVVRIHQTGMFTPVDAELEYRDGLNVLTLSLSILYMEDPASVPDIGKLHEAVRKGIREWEGDYTVFGGQKLRLIIRLTENDRVFDNVMIMVMSGEVLDVTRETWNQVDNKRARKLKKMVLEDGRAMAVAGLKKWTPRSRKIIYLQTSTGDFTDYDEIAGVMKHEFGHTIGLGDLYEEADAGLPGVPAGSYPELDSYLIRDDMYHLVMCNHHGVISNNDIEMVVLAFSEQRMQQYQPTKVMKQISKALGRGN